MKQKNLSEKTILNSLERKWGWAFEEDAGPPDTVYEALHTLEDAGVYSFPFSLDDLVIHDERIPVLGDLINMSERSDLIKSMFHYDGLVILFQDKNLSGLDSLYFIKQMTEIDEWNTWLSVMGTNMSIHINTRPSHQMTVMASPIKAFQHR